MMLRLTVNTDGSLRIAGLNGDGNVIATMQCDPEAAIALRDALIELFPTHDQTMDR